MVEYEERVMMSALSAAKFLGVSTFVIWSLVKKGKLKPYKKAGSNQYGQVKGKTQFLTSDLVKLKKENE